MMDELLPDATVTEVDPADGCAVLDVASGQLTSIACNENTARTALCQYPGLPFDGTATGWQTVRPRDGDGTATGLETLHVPGIKCVLEVQRSNPKWNEDDAITQQRLR